MYLFYASELGANRHESPGSPPRAFCNLPEGLPWRTRLVISIDAVALIDPRHGRATA
jgi:hypothetical protein